eukprot:5712172-Amphidinium_carterae.1
MSPVWGSAFAEHSPSAQASALTPSKQLAKSASSEVQYMMRSRERKGYERSVIGFALTQNRTAPAVEHIEL